MKRVAVWLVFLSLPAHAGTLDAWADDLVARAAPALPPGGDVALAVHGRDPGVARLAAALEGLVLARLPGRSTAVVAGVAAARAQGFDALLDVEVALDGGEAVALAKVLPAERDLWRAAAGAEPVGAVSASAVARARVDGELRSYVTFGPGPTTAPVARARRMSFRALRAGLDLGAPLLALAAADLDGDGTAELVALTTGEVAVLRVLADGVAIVARARLEGPPPVPRPRTPVGTLTIVEREILARSSEHAAGGIFTFAAGGLARSGEPRDYPTCPSGGVALVPGMSLFSRDAERFLASACGPGVSGLVDAAGALRLFRPGDPKPMGVIAGVGTAFALADIDADGAIELVAAAWRPPGTRDALTVYRLATDGTARPAARPVAVPAVAALAAGDFDGDGIPDVIAAAHGGDGDARYELWQLE